jgi:hypothetical protein
VARRVATSSAERVIWFGAFRLLPAQRTLLEADQPVRFGGRARFLRLPD